MKREDLRKMIKEEILKELKLADIIQYEEQFFKDFKKYAKGKKDIYVGITPFRKWAMKNKIPKSVLGILMARIGNNESNEYMARISFDHEADV